MGVGKAALSQAIKQLIESKQDQAIYISGVLGIYDTGGRREYGRGDNISIQVNITAYHKGYFEIELCPTYPESEDCFVGIHHFSIENTSLEGGNPTYYFDAQLPPNVTCERCVLRWFWVTNNSPGLPPEFFINCADISIQ
jgi:hypothetical protein